MLISADTVPASNSPAEEPVPNTELTSETGGLLAVLADSTLMLGVVYGRSVLTVWFSQVRWAYSPLNAWVFNPNNNVKNVYL